MKKIVFFLSSIVCFVMIAGSVRSSDFSFGYQRNGVEAVKALDGLNVGGVEEDREDGLLQVARDVVNWVLGILGLIALIIVIYGGLLMVFSAGEDEQYKKGWSIMKSALIGLVIIGVAWFVISLIIWILQKVAIGTGGADSDV